MTATHAKPKTRTMTFHANTDPHTPTTGVLVIAAGNETTTYVVEEFSTGHTTRGFTLSKPVGGGSYTAFICRHGAEGDSCTCEAATYRRRGGKACRHAAGLRKLIELGRI